MLDSYYTGEFKDNSEVLDAKRLYADRDQFADKMKSAQRLEPVYVWRPKAGDTINVSDKPPQLATGNEIVFLKKLTPVGSKLKIYIPSGTGGKLTEATLDEKYEPGVAYHPRNPESNPILQALSEGATVTCRTAKRLLIPILEGCIDRDAVILNARGPGEHQFLKPGDSLKFEDGDCLPLPKAELDSTWQVAPIQSKTRG